MKAIGWFALGAIAATAIVARLTPANESQCCQRVAYGARDKLAGYAGPLSGLVSGALDGLGLTKHFPSLLERAGVPLDA